MNVRVLRNIGELNIQAAPNAVNRGNRHWNQFWFLQYPAIRDQAGGVFFSSDNTHPPPVADIRDNQIIFTSWQAGHCKITIVICDRATPIVNTNTTTIFQQGYLFIDLDHPRHRQAQSFTNHAMQPCRAG